MEDSLFEDIIDDWFIESLKTYKDLHVYQLEHPTQVIEWTSGKSVCVAGNSSSRNEILELRLPLKLFAEEKKGLCAERDFKVIHGGFSDGPVRRLTHVPGTRVLVTNDGLSSDLQLWERGADDSDVIRRTGGIEGRRNVSRTGSRIAAATLSSGQQVLHGSQSDDIVLCDITSGRTVYTLDVSSSAPVSALQCVSDGVFMVCCSNGKVYLWDTRSPAPPLLSPAPALLSAAPQATDRGVLWWGHASTGQARTYQDCRLIRLSSVGQAVITDLRDLQRGVCGAQLEAQNQLCSLDTVCVTWAPALDDCVAVSGLSGSVQIYNTSVWSSDQQQEVQQPMFQHRGHTVTSHSNHLSTQQPSNHLSSQQPSNHLSTQPSNRILVTAHAWHPSRPCTLLSAASDGSVHVWDWIHQSHAGK